MVRMAQDFSLRYPLVDGQGNFGSIDGDRSGGVPLHRSQASRRSRPSCCVELHSRHRRLPPDLRRHRPRADSLCPPRFPHLLVNGTTGIAVGMATSIPPHNLGEVVRAIVELIDEPDANVDGADEERQGPGLPDRLDRRGETQGIRDAYRTGRGRIVMRARAHIEELRGGKTAIIVTELPYGVKKGRRLRRDQEDRRPRRRER